METSTGYIKAKSLISIAVKLKNMIHSSPRRKKSTTIAKNYFQYPAGHFYYDVSIKESLQTDGTVYLIIQVQHCILPEHILNEHYRERAGQPYIAPPRAKVSSPRPAAFLVFQPAPAGTGVVPAHISRPGAQDAPARLLLRAPLLRDLPQ